ncbi:Radical S-adenosyl methionine domain-containing protein 2 [Frankliniella fusca]|uniref:Radical S-adenosyl methionine domain-containing protein 2 n=1 Tax=Frankliniella fusca TaxID=407009 RepID=A0AAE1LPM1_9NEOP|nr:Radical S-adenosyl methionine domain-containing protein 2 [Frankliniella fusca]
MLEMEMLIRAFLLWCGQILAAFLVFWQNLEKKFKRRSLGDAPSPPIVPLSVNYHFTRKCNYKCGFCFHTALTSFYMPLEEAKCGLRLLKDKGMKKVNFSGGEPFIHGGDHIGELVRFCKQDLRLDSVSIVSNGSLIRKSWFRKYGDHLDILAVSCDSFVDETNERIGRCGETNRAGAHNKHVDKLHQIHAWCREYRVSFKINTVVNTFNKDEDMSEHITRLNPMRWKVFQCLLLEGENCGENALRDAEPFYISDEDFQKFLDRHKSVPVLVPESNKSMQNSYLLLDEYMRFLNCVDGGKKPSKSILDVGVDNAINDAGFDEAMFFKRGGVYEWSNEDKKKSLDW